jgi:ornithine cyclodeaminase
MAVRWITGAQVRQLLDMDSCIAAMRRVMVQTSRGEVIVPPRSALQLASGDLFALMPGAMNRGAPGEPELFGIKLISLFHDNPAAGLPAHLGLVVLFEGEHGRPTAILGAAEVTAIRTAAASALATDVLARRDTPVLALLGTGDQAVSHLAALTRVREFDEIRIWGRSPEKVDAFIATHREAAPGLRPAATVREAVAGADVICTLTGAGEPILHGAWLAPGCHVNLVGASQPTRAEADAEVVTRARFFVDYRQSAFDEAGELLMAIEAGLITRDHVCGELGQVIAGEVPGRRDDRDITVYKSLGFAAQDLAACDLVARRAEAQGIGVMLEL